MLAVQPILGFVNAVRGSLNSRVVRTVVACVLAIPFAWGGLEFLRSRGSSGLGRAAVISRMTPSSRAPRVDPLGMTIGSRFAPPEGYEREPAAATSYATWLRALPLRPDGAPVLLHSGELKARQDVHAAVIDRNPGSRDLQQCADAAIRLRAEYLHSVDRFDGIAFHFTSGFLCSFAKWRGGGRVEVEGTRVRWIVGGAVDSSRAALSRYLDVVFTYAGTASLPRDVEPVLAGGPPEPGDIYLQPGSPGHAMTVVDVAARGKSRVMLLAQSYMPAQEIHIVRNPASPSGVTHQSLACSPSPLFTHAWSRSSRRKAKKPPDTQPSDGGFSAKLVTM